MSTNKVAEWTARHASGQETWAEIAASEGVTYDVVRQAVRRARRDKRPPVLHVTPEFATPAPDELSLDEFVELTQQNQRAVNSVDPQLINETITIDSDGPIGIVFVSCAHLGSRYVSHRDFKNYLDKVLDIPRLYWFAMGDDTEGFTGFFDTSSAHEQALADPKVQRRMLALVLDKLAAKNKLLCGFASQHGSDWVKRRVAEDPIKNMYLSRGVPYFDGQAYIHLKVGGQVYKIFAAHEMPGNSAMNKVHAQKKAALYKAPNADVIVQGDKHSYAVQHTALDTYEFLAGERPSPYQWYVQTGTAKTGYDPYTIKTWSPGVWEWATLIFRADEHRIAQAADLKLARLMLTRW